MYSHLCSSCTTSWSESCRVLAVFTGQIDPTQKVAARDDAYTAGDVCCPGLDLWNFPKAYTDAMQTCDMLH